MLQKSCPGEVCQYLRVREITRTSSTEGVGLQPPQPGSARHASAASTLPFVAQERNTLGSAGSGNSGAVSETEAAFLLSLTHMNDLRIFLCMGNECGFCSAFQNGLFWGEKNPSAWATPILRSRTNPRVFIAPGFLLAHPFMYEQEIYFKPSWGEMVCESRINKSVTYRTINAAALGGKLVLYSNRPSF